KPNCASKNRSRKNADSDPRLKSLLTAFKDKYQTRTRTPYVATEGKDHVLLKGFLTAGYDVGAIETTMDLYFADEYQAKIGFDIGGFKRTFNRLLSAGAKKPHDYEAGAYPEP